MQIINEMITYKIVDDVVKIKHIIKVINDIKNKSRFEGVPHELIEEKIKKDVIHSIDQILHSCSAGILPIKSNRLLTVTTAHSEVEINPIILLIRKRNINALRIVTILLNTDPKNVPKNHLIELLFIMFQSLLLYDLSYS
jgi:hypothetical protein